MTGGEIADDRGGRVIDEPQAGEFHLLHWGGGHDAWKVGGKMFACIGAVMPGVSVKTDMRPQKCGLKPGSE